MINLKQTLQVAGATGHNVVMYELTMYTEVALTFGARTSMDFSVSSLRKADVSENPFAT